MWEPRAMGSVPVYLAGLSQTAPAPPGGFVISFPGPTAPFMPSNNCSYHLTTRKSTCLSL